jgi:AbiV family abortive infection protein
MRTTLSPRKYKQLALESLRNSLRLLKDAMALYEIGSYPTSFQLSILAIEEYAKAKWVDHVYYTSITNNGLPDVVSEQEWLRILYSHTEKQSAFFWWEKFSFSPRLQKAISTGELDRSKQNATYVGLPKRGKQIDVNARVSLPSSFKRNDAKRMISLLAKEIRDTYKIIDRHDTSFGIEELDEVLTSHEAMFVFSWAHSSGLKSNRYKAMNGVK